MLKNQDTIIAILRPRGFKSSFMMDVHHKLKLIKIFEFKETPEERINDILRWAEILTSANEKHYNRKYTWRKDYL